MPSTPRRSSILAAALCLGLTACEAPVFGDNCRADRIVAHFEGTLAVDGGVIEIDREDAVAPSNIPVASFRDLNDVLLEGGAATGGVVWSHGGIGSANDFFAVALSAPLQTGQVRAVTTTFQGGGWGPLAVQGAALALRLEDVWATEVEGEVTVVQGAPLRLGVNLDITLSDGGVLTLTGTDTFRYERGSCGDARG
ncbi:MAG: hypothetical protein WEA24_02665 [Gemmatimonadota bacterium]